MPDLLSLWTAPNTSVVVPLPWVHTLDDFPKVCLGTKEHWETQTLDLSLLMISSVDPSKSHFPIYNLIFHFWKMDEVSTVFYIVYGVKENSDKGSWESDSSWSS